MKRRATTALCAFLISASMLTATSSAHAAAVVSWQSVRLEVKQATAGGTTFAWAELGSGTPLLLLNGTASPMNEWDPAFLAGLSRSNRVIVFDYPGLGDSGAAPGSWTFEHAADWIADFASAVAPHERVNVLGWSMGGFIAQQLTIRHPEIVKNLVLAATNPGGSQAVLGPTWVQEIDSSASSDWDYLRTNYPPAGIAAGRRFLARLDASFENGHYSPTDTPERTLNAMVGAEEPWLRSNANLHQLASVSAPTLVIDGTRDLITPPMNSIVIASSIPGALLRTFPGAGHSFLFQYPDKVASVVSQFMSGNR